jgi:uncharacterized 2Fe-2S/4Fe-4S cluster protein (DUF4445 family)
MPGAARDPIIVTFEPEGRTVSVLPGTLLIEAAGKAGIVLETPCGGQGVCGKCRVEITRNAPEPCEADRRMLTKADLERGSRLACQVHVAQEMCVHVPIATRFFEHKILTDGRGRAVTLHPTVTKQHVQLPPPALNDQRADADRLLDALGKAAKVELDIGVLKTRPTVLRSQNFDVTAVSAEGRLVALEPGDTCAHNYGIAFDIGTTTVVGFLMDLVNGRELAVAARTNPQIPFGDDVVSRIRYATTNANGLRELQEKIVGCLNDIIAECCKTSGIACKHLYEATVVGNTTMSHIFLGVDPEFVAQAPYVAGFRRSVNVLGRDVGLHIHPHGVVHVLPNIAGFVGADTVGVILASGMHEAEERVLAIDIGTNGELVIGNKDRLVSCSTAAGPAFEGARIRYGMRAADGAIDKLIINHDVQYNVIGNLPPRGLCGTALIDLVAELLRVGAVESTGRLLPSDEMPASVPDAIKRRVVRGESALEFIIVHKEETSTGGALCLTQRDIRELQLAKGAIAAGAAILIKEFGLEPKDLGHVLLAGAFGNFIRRNMARRIGLLPDVPTDRILYIGNAAGAGARMALQSRRCKEEANRISDVTEYLELAGRADFQQEFTNAMMFPEA